VVTQWAAIWSAGGEQKAGRLQASARENVTAGPDRDALAVEGAASQVVSTRAVGTGDDLSARETRHHANERRPLEVIGIFTRKVG
jgi:hypothetical protein